MKFLTNHSKLIYYTFGIVLGVSIILGLFYATNYADVHVYYTVSDGVQFGYTAAGPISNTSNKFVYDFFTSQPASSAFAVKYGNDFGVYAPVVYDFQKLLSSVNTNIIVFEFVSLICFALLLVLSNHTRRVYYKSNLIGGILLPLTVIVLNVILMVQNLNVMNAFDKNSELFNVVAVLQNSTTGIEASQKDFSYLQQHFSVTNLSLVLYTVLFVVVIVISIFASVYAVLKYKATAKDREEILKKAVQNND